MCICVCVSPTSPPPTTTIVTWSSFLGQAERTLEVGSPLLLATKTGEKACEVEEAEAEAEAEGGRHSKACDEYVQPCPLPFQPGKRRVRPSDSLRLDPFQFPPSRPP